MGGLHADAVPLPFGDEVGRCYCRKLLVLDLMRQHQRPEHRRPADLRPRRLAGEPGEQLDIRRLQPVPHFLDIGERYAGPLRKRGLGEPRRDTDAERSGQELQQRPAPSGVEPVEPARQQRRHLHRQGRLHRLDDGREPGRLTGARLAWPDQGNGLGRVADIVARQVEQHGIDAYREHVGQDAAKRQPEEQPVGECGQRIAAVGIGHGSEIIGQQLELVVARRRVSEPVEESGEILHWSSSSRPIKASARPRRPVVWM